MSWQEGDVVVHPQHGTARVGRTETRDLGDGPVEYLVLQLDSDGMTILVPAGDVTVSGVREPISRAEASSVLDVLRSEPAEDPGHSGRRRRDGARLRTGDPADAAEVVRDLAALDEAREKGLTAPDQRNFDAAHQAVVQELAVVLGVDEEEAARQVDEAIDQP